MKGQCMPYLPTELLLEASTQLLVQINLRGSPLNPLIGYFLSDVLSIKSLSVSSEAGPRCLIG